MQEWLSLVYGDDEAARIMTLPAELRRALYGDVILLGPAGEKIMQVLPAVGESFEQGRGLWDIQSVFAIFNDYVFTVGGVASSPAKQITAFSSLESRWAWSNLDNEFQIFAEKTTAGIKNLEGIRERTIKGMVSLAWMLTAPYVVPANSVIKDSLVITRTNRFLTSLGFPRLGGSFNDCVDGGRL